MKLIQLDLLDNTSNNVYINAEFISQITVSNRGFCVVILNNGSRYIVKKTLAEFIEELNQL